MNLTLPVDGGSANVWNVILDQVFIQIDAHDHSTGKGVAISSTGLNIVADVPFAGNSPTGLKASVFNAVAAASVSLYANALFTNSSDNNLYFRNSGGTNVQLTSGPSAYGAGARTLNVPAVMAHTTSGGAATVTPLTMSVVLSTDANTVGYPLQIEIGAVINSWKLFLQKTSAAGTITAQLKKCVGATGVVSSLGASANNSANNPGFVSLTASGINYTTVAGESYQLSVTGGGVAGDSLFDCDFGYTR
jgi:hypothetical protein